MIISNSGPKMVLVEQFEQSRCFGGLSPQLQEECSSDAK